MHHSISAGSMTAPIHTTQIPSFSYIHNPHHVRSHLRILALSTTCFIIIIDSLHTHTSFSLSLVNYSPSSHLRLQLVLIYIIPTPRQSLRFEQNLDSSNIFPSCFSFRKGTELLLSFYKKSEPLLCHHDCSVIPTYRGYSCQGRRRYHPQAQKTCPRWWRRGRLLHMLQAQCQMRSPSTILLSMPRDRQRMLRLQDTADLGRWCCQPWQASRTVFAHCQGTSGHP